jgi:hypothetical protein
LRAAAVACAVFCGFASAAHAQSGGLKIGEYACYGSGGTLLMGLGFKVLDGSHYNDLDGKSPGTFAVNGSSVAFTGGHLAGETGHNLNNGRFVLGTLATCEPFR